MYKADKLSDESQIVAMKEIHVNKNINGFDAIQKFLASEI